MLKEGQSGFSFLKTLSINDLSQSHLLNEFDVQADWQSDHSLAYSALAALDSRKSSSICSWSMWDGESIITSRPWLFLGKAM